MTNLELANPDCLASKIKIGNKGAQALSDYLKRGNCILSILDLTGAALTTEAMTLVAQGVISCKGLVSLNLSSNSIGQ